MTFSQSTPTRTDRTEACYRARYASLERQLTADKASRGEAFDVDVDLDFPCVVDFFLGKRKEWSRSTERQYRASVMFVLNEAFQTGRHDCWRLRGKIVMESDPTAEDSTGYYRSEDESISSRSRIEKELIEIANSRKNSKSEKKRQKIKGNTSEQKAKKVDKEDIKLIIDALDRSSSKWANDTKLWFQAGLIAGLRPSEWGGAEITFDDNGVKTLVVKNGKNSNQRTFSDNRHIVIDEISAEHLHILRSFCDVASKKQERGHYEAWYNECRTVMRRTVLKLFPGRMTRPSLYTSRHMFAADAKMRLTKKEVAALLGHGSETVAGTHYARKQKISGGSGVKPSEVDLAALTMRNGPDQLSVREGAFNSEKRSAERT